jgi:hypothetical protein
MERATGFCQTSPRPSRACPRSVAGPARSRAGAQARNPQRERRGEHERARVGDQRQPRPADREQDSAERRAKRKCPIRACRQQSVGSGQVLAAGDQRDVAPAGGQVRRREQRGDQDDDNHGWPPPHPGERREQQRLGQIAGHHQPLVVRAVGDGARERPEKARQGEREQQDADSGRATAEPVHEHGKCDPGDLVSGDRGRARAPIEAEAAVPREQALGHGGFSQSGVGCRFWSPGAVPACTES